MSIIHHFPYPTPREQQVRVLAAIERAYRDGHKYVLVQSPVGSGKSPMALACARHFGQSHILTPRKQLQDQYYADFHQHVVLMKGRSSYPCFYHQKDDPGFNRMYNSIIRDVRVGRTPPTDGEHTTDKGPCTRVSDDAYTSLVQRCSSNDTYICPYQAAVAVAEQNNHVIHNVFSFIFQTSMADKFSQRPILIVDECHDLPDIIRSFLSKKVILFRPIREDQIPDFTTIEEWVEWFLHPDQRPKREAKDPNTGLTPHEERIVALEESIMAQQDKFGVDIKVDDHNLTTEFVFTPIHIGNAPKKYLFDYGEKVLLMSGTIYDKVSYCRELGVDPKEVAFIDVNSTFPRDIRPITMPKNLMVNTSHKTWRDNFDDLIESIRTILDKHPDVKGLIQTPSYRATEEICRALKDPRIMSHGPEDFTDRLEYFYRTNGTNVFVSPVCQQGVDFKDDRARFQIICRVPYLNAGAGVVKYMLRNNFQWYNWKSLIVFGQQCGRINRSEEDYGETYLLDSRFPQFIQKNKRYLPQWFLQSFRISKQ